MHVLHPRPAELRGFDGNIVDMTLYNEGKNMTKAREVIDYFCPRGITAEAETGEN